MKTQLIFLKDFYCPLHKKWFIAADPKNSSTEIDIDEYGVATHSFWHTQLKDSPEYFQLVTTNPKPKK